MRHKLIFLVSIVGLSLFLAACVTTNVYPEPPQRILTVNGTGMVTLTPDIAYASIGVQTKDPSVGSAVRANNATTQAVINAIKSFGVEEKDITTTNFSVWLNERYDDKGNVVEQTYIVQNTVQVKVRNLNVLGDLLDAAIQAGANSIYSIFFDVEDRTEAINKARALAIESARKQAEELAKAAGVTLGEVQSISFYDSAPYTGMAGKGGDDGIERAAASSVPVLTGEFQIIVTVTINYTLK